MTSLSDLLQQPLHSSVETETKISPEIPSQDQPGPTQSRPADISQHKLHSDYCGGGRAGGEREGAGHGPGLHHRPSTHTRPHLVSRLSHHNSHLTSSPTNIYSETQVQVDNTFLTVEDDFFSTKFWCLVRAEADHCWHSDVRLIIAVTGASQVQWGPVLLSAGEF